MLYIDISENTQSVYVPRNGWEPDEGGTVTLTAISTSDRTAVSFTVHEWVTDGQFLKLTIGLPEDLFVGEWEYALSIEDEEMSTGILQVTEEADEPTQYDKEITYKQYGE